MVPPTVPTSGGAGVQEGSNAMLHTTAVVALAMQVDSLAVRLIGEIHTLLGEGE